MFFRWYRKKIANSVADKMAYMGTCPNERDIILAIIAPKDYRRKGIHCNTDCWITGCKSYNFSKK